MVIRFFAATLALITTAHAGAFPIPRVDGIQIDGSDADWGIGCTWFDKDGLSSKTFAHGAASTATLRIDPLNRLVVVMTRNAGGDYFNQYVPGLMENIVGHLPQPVSEDT